MTKTLTLLTATAAVVLALGMPALAALSTDAGPRATAAPEATALRLAEGDDEGGWFRAAGRDHDEDEGACDDDEGGCGAAPAAAPAGTVAPPKNGLFAPGAAPQVQTN